MPFDEDFNAVLRTLRDEGIVCMVVGGVALQAYGVVRATFDVDIQVALPEPPSKSRSIFLGLLVEEWTKDTVFGQDVLVGHLASRPTPIELFVATHWFTRQALAQRRSTPNPYGDEPLWIPRLEDLILLKAAFMIATDRSRRKSAQDGVDIETLIARADALDLPYLEQNARKLGVWEALAPMLPSG